MNEIDYEFQSLNSPVCLQSVAILSGANYYSGAQVIIMRINLNEYDEVFTSGISGFYEAITTRLPSLIEHYCSEGFRGGFFKRIEDGTLLGHVIEHVAIELQTLAGMDVSYGKTRSTLEQGVYNVVFRFFDEVAGIYAGKAALHLINAILLQQHVDVEKIVRKLVEIRENRMLGPSTQAIVEELQLRKIPFYRLDEYNLIQAGTGRFQKRLRATLTPYTSAIASDISQDRYSSLQMISDAGLPVVQCFLPRNSEHLQKYLSANFGEYIIMHRYRKSTAPIAAFISNSADVLRVMNILSKDNEEVLLMLHHKLRVFKFLVINKICMSVSCVYVPTVKGNGISTIEELVFLLNSHPMRERGDKGKLSQVEIDLETEVMLSSFHLERQSVLADGQSIPLKMFPNPNNGSYTVNISETVHHTFMAIAEKAVSIIGLDVASVTIVANNVNVPYKDSQAYITEVHSAPNFRTYIQPTKGIPSQIIPKFVDYIFPDKNKTHIPLISVTGSFGKTTCCKIIYNCLQAQGYHCGLSVSDAVVSGKYKIQNNNNTSHKSASIILKDADVDLAVIETPVELILQSGLHYDWSDYGIVLNISDNHVFEHDISLVDDIAYAKSVVAETVRENGYAILNADEPLIMEMLDRVGGKCGLFSNIPQSKHVITYIQEGKPVAVFNGETLQVFFAGKQVFEIERTILALWIKENLLYESIMAAILVLFLFGVNTESIRKSLENMSL